ncbi:MAG TPA: hypothetical protein VF062_11820 [Candidatus Limnocylindrales bacterium]
MNYTPVRHHLVEAILSDPNGEWTVREMTERLSTRDTVPTGAVQDSLYLMLANNFLEAVPFQQHLTLRLRHDQTNPFAPTATVAKRLADLLARWREQHGTAPPRRSN